MSAVGAPSVPGDRQRRLMPSFCAHAWQPLCPRSARARCVSVGIFGESGVRDLARAADPVPVGQTIDDQVERKRGQDTVESGDVGG
jgi:hypothetical protein